MNPSQRSSLRRSMAIAASLMLVPCLALAAPTQVTQQGRLVDADGAGLTGSHSISFSLFSDSAGTASVWSEDHTLELDDGYYSVILGAGSGTELDDTVLALSPLYLGMSVDGGTLMQPLLEVTSAPYAVMAESSVNLDGGYVDANSLYIEGDLVVDGNGDWVGNVLPGTLGALGCADGEEARYTAASGWGCVDPGIHYTGAQAVTAMGALDNGNPLNHNRYTDTQAVTAMGALDNGNPLNHNRYTDTQAVAAVGPHYTGAQAVTAMGALDNGNPLNHNRYTDTQAVAAVGPHYTDAQAVAAVGIVKMQITQDCNGGDVTFVDSTGTSHSLNISAGNTENSHIAFRTSNGDDTLYFNIEGTTGSCTLLHSEDDSARPGFYFGTDAGNGMSSVWGNLDTQTFILKREGASDLNVLGNCTGYHIACF
jgi:hypothetical protein